MTVAFIGLAFHFQTTKSTQFLLKILESQWPQLQTWTPEETWRRVGLRKRWDLVVYLQYLPPLSELSAIGARRTVLVPMFDASSLDPQDWEPYRGIPVLAFSTTQGDLLRSWGHDVRVVTYATPVPPQECDWSEGLRGFFWPRTPQLTWEHIKPLLPEGMKMHIHFTDTVHSDPRIQLPSPEERERFGITTSSWFASPADLEKVLRTCNVYFAPRRSEGIGMSFLEATGLGMAVVACNQPTMNEVIRHDEDGWLYDPEHPERPDWSRARNWGKAARAKHLVRRRQWEESIPDTIRFLNPEEHAAQEGAPKGRFRRVVLAHLEHGLRLAYRGVKRTIRAAMGSGATR